MKGSGYMQEEYVLPLITQQVNNDEFNFMMVLNAKKEIIWVNEKALNFLGADLSIENHLDPSSMSEWYSYLNKVKVSSVDKVYVSLLNKRKEFVHFIASGTYNHWNETYVIKFKPIYNRRLFVEQYDKTFKILDEMHIGVYVSRINGFIFSTNETAKSIVPNACQMSIFTLFQRFFNPEQFGHYIKLLNEHTSFSAEVTCKITNNQYHLMYRFDYDCELHVVMIQQLLLKEMAEQQSKRDESLDKETAASIVHEIRNPLTALQGFITLMKSDGIHNAQYLQALENEILRMDYLLSGMLQSFKPKAKCSPIECNTFLQQILLLLEMDVKNKNICLIYSQSSEPCYILGNEYSLTQIFINIIKNSIQAMNHNGSIAITFNKTPNNELEICIKDTGCGMSEEQLSNLFVPYYTTKESGTGLGLPVVKKLLEEMNGRIEVQSELGKGTEVYIYLQLTSESNILFIN